MTMIRAAVMLLALVAPLRAATIFDGDPGDGGHAYAILPGVPLILPQPDGKFDPPIVTPSIVGDVDLVVRAADVGSVGPLMPAPVATPPTAVAGGVRVVAGSEVPFSVIAADAAGNPLGGTSLDGIPVIVAAWADLDGDGIVGPTAIGDEIGLQEAHFLVGRQVAVFSGGVAHGSVAVWKGAPASAGGLHVVLTALAWVGPFSPGFFEGNVPDGPGVATLLPFFPRLDPDRVVDGEGRGGPATPDGRIGIELEPAFDIPIADPVLGTPFALPTNGSSPTIDRAVVVGGTMSRAQLVMTAPATGYALDVEAPLRLGAGGELLVPRTSLSLVDDGEGGGAAVRVVPVDLLDQVTDPPVGATATLIAGPGLVVAEPDADGDPTRETVALSSAAGVTVTIDDAGGANDSGAASALTVLTGGVPTDALPVTLTTGPVVLPPDSPPVVLGAGLEGQPAAIGRRCATTRTLAAIVDAPPSAPPTVTADVSVAGTLAQTLTLQPGTRPAGLSLPAGPVYTAPLSLADPALGVLDVMVSATNANGTATPFAFSVPIVTVTPPSVGAPSVTSTVPTKNRRRVSVGLTAAVHDECGIRRVVVELAMPSRWRRVAKMRDDGRRGDAVARDGVFTGTVRVPAKLGTARLRVTARNTEKQTSSGPETAVVVGP